MILHLLIPDPTKAKRHCTCHIIELRVLKTAITDLMPTLPRLCTTKQDFSNKNIIKKYIHSLTSEIATNTAHVTRMLAP